MSQDDSIKTVQAVIRKNRRFLVCSHLNPEGDALGSALALAALLKRLGKSVVVANEGGLPDSLKFLPRVVPVLADPNRKVPAEVAVTVDVPTFSRVGVMQPMIQRAGCVMNIDHHVSNQRFGRINWVDPKAAAVGEMIFRLYQAFRVKPAYPEAVCMYVSLVTDTGSFRYMSTTAPVHRMAADLIEAGVRPLEVAQHLYESRTPSDLRFLGDVLRDIRHTPDGRAAWLEIPLRMVQRAKPGEDVQDELVNYPRSIRSAEVAFILRESEEPGKIRVSFRSKGRIDVDAIARSFGGGGHIAASGCTIEGTLAQARAKVLKAVRQALRRSVRGSTGSPRTGRATRSP